MRINNLEHEKLKTAVILARMYGVKETLEPLSDYYHAWKPLFSHLGATAFSL